MVEEKRERAEEASDSPQKSPRLDPLAGPGCSDAPASPTESSDEWPSSGEAEAGTSSDSTGDGGRCEHIRLDRELLDMHVYYLTEQRAVLRTCHLSKCKTTCKGNEGMMKCIDCAYFFCSGWPVDIENPQGHARWHAGEHQHWVAQWCDEPNLGYCFMCARPMRLSDWSEDDYAVSARNKKDQQGLGDSVAKYGWGSVAGIAKDGCKTGGKNPQNPENLDLPASKAPVLLSESPSTGEAEETSDCTYGIGSCAHLFKDREELDDGLPELGASRPLAESKRLATEVFLLNDAKPQATISVGNPPKPPSQEGNVHAFG